MKSIITLSCFLMSICVQAQVFDLVVAKDGSGDYTTISRALTSRSDFNTIFIKNGIYEEKVRVAKSGLRLIGESVNGVVIQNADYNGDVLGNSTSSSYTLLLEADDFYMENITVKNTAGDVGQAVAVRTTGDEITINSCKFYGFQDTYYVDGGGKVYNQNVYIEGATDFIFGDATAVFRDCQINCVRGGQYITAPADPKATIQTGAQTVYLGLLMINCDITSDSDVADQTYYLGRPWKENSSSVFVNCTLGDHIRGKGWDEWDNHETAFAAEYQSIDKDGALVDVSGRADWSLQLTGDQVNEYYNMEAHLQPGSWVLDPREAIKSPESPQNVSFVASGTTNSPIIKWNEIEGVLGYVILRNGIVEGFSESNSYQSFDVREITNYAVKSVSTNGALSESSVELDVNPAKIVLSNTELEDSAMRRDKSNTFILSEKADVLVYSLNGKVVFKEKNISNFKLATNLKGVFVVKCNFDTNCEVYKISL